MEKTPVKYVESSKEQQPTQSDHVEVSEYDVLCGRGKIPYNHGASKFR
jgi:hypothetical protein